MAKLGLCPKRTRLAKVGIENKLWHTKYNLVLSYVGVLRIYQLNIPPPFADCYGSLPHAFLKKLLWLAKTNVITTKTHKYAVNAR